MGKCSRNLLFVGVLIICSLLSGSAWCQRVLVVTTEQQSPRVYSNQNGMNVIGDLVAHGYPFDLVTYGRFVNMALGDHDVIILNGHTSPTSIYSVFAKCQSALQEGRKVFLNGNLTCRQYDPNGQNPTILNYHLTLFSVADNGTRKLNGTPAVSPGFEKDPAITSTRLTDINAKTFRFSTAPSMTVSCGGYTFGYLYPNGGFIDGSVDYYLNLLDYGKVVSFLRYGTAPGIGFANDRMGGKHIASFDVHCDSSKDQLAVDHLYAMAQRLNMPLMCLLVYNKLDAASIAKWNSVAGPLMLLGSHTMTHPMDWKYQDMNYQVANALSLQRQVIPSTRDFFDPSGNQELSMAQLDAVTTLGIECGGAGADYRTYDTPGGGPSVYVQRLPTRSTWFRELSKSTVSPFYLSQTVDSDYAVWSTGGNYLDEVKRCYAWNLRYGMYTYGYIHDYMFGAQTGYTTGGVQMSVLENQAMDYLAAQGVTFISTEHLIHMLDDYLAGRVDHVDNPDGSVTVTVTRPGALANEIKVGWKGGYAPTAIGECVESQQLTGECLYITLRAEVVSTLQINWVESPLVAPAVSSASDYVSPASIITWEESINPTGVIEYQYAVGTTSGGTDILNWTSAGSNASTSLALVNSGHGKTCYVSVKARYANTGWGPVGVSRPLLLDLTPPVCKVTDGGDTQSSIYELNAEWSANDPESGIVEAKYAIGTAPGWDDFQHWTPATGSTVGVTSGQRLQVGKTYYVTVKTCNSAGLWTETSSDGITIVPELTLGAALTYRDSVQLTVPHLVVTAVLSDKLYVQDVERSAGVRLTGASVPLHEGDLLTATGSFTTSSQERVFTAQTVTITGYSLPKPMHILNRYLGGGYRDRVPSPSGGVGLNNIGLLVRISGKVTEIGQGYIRLDDGSMCPQGPDDEPAKVKIDPIPSNLQIGSWVLATGISTLEYDHNGLRRLLLTRRSSDLIVVVR